MFIPTLLDFFNGPYDYCSSLLLRVNGFPRSCKYSFQFFDVHNYISNRTNNKIPKESTTKSPNRANPIIPSNNNLSKMNTIDKETNTIESKPVSLNCLCCRRETIVFKKLHENPPNKLPHVMCLLCYQYVIKDMGYDFCPKSSKFNVICSIFNWFQRDICKQRKFQYSVAKTFHHRDHKPVKFCKFCVEDSK